MSQTRFGRRTFLAGAAAGLAITARGSAQGVVVDRAAAIRAAQKRTGTLAQAAAARGVLFGSASESDVLRVDRAYADLIARECSVIAPEGSLKATETRRSPDGFDFTKAEALMAFAFQNELAFRGHTLVWYRVPAWVNNLTDSVKVRQELILEVAEPCRHFRGRIDSWDVVNEPIALWDKDPDGFRSSVWYRCLGREYISIAFETARSADPNPILVLNENSLETAASYDEEKRPKVLDLLRDLKRNNVPVDALGIEAHLGSVKEERPFNAAVFHRFLSEVEQLGLKVLITELDLNDALLPADVRTRDSLVAKQMYEFLSVVLRFSNVITVGVWGLSDNHSWLQTYAPRPDGLPERPTLFDLNLNSKPAYAAVRAAFDVKARS